MLLQVVPLHLFCRLECPTGHKPPNLNKGVFVLFYKYNEKDERDDCAVRVKKKLQSHGCCNKLLS